MTLKINCWLCGSTSGIIAPSEIPSLPALIRCQSCNCNQGAVASNQTLKLSQKSKF